MPICPAGTGTASPTSGRLPAGVSPSARAISVTAGRAGSSTRLLVRWVLVRATPGNWATACTKSGVKYAVSPVLAVALPLVVRMYRSAGSTWSSQWVTESRKLATITVSATARLSDATTPLMATAALPRMRRARSTASSGSRRCATSGARRSYTCAVSQGRALMPPTSSSAMAT